MNKEALKKELRILGFTRFEHLQKEWRDGKTRFIFLRPLQKYVEWFEVRIVEENDELRIEKLVDPFCKTFNDADVSGLLEYIKDHIHKHVGTDAEC